MENNSTNQPINFKETPAPNGFWQIEKFRTIRVVKGAKPSDKFASVPVCGESLKNHGIFDSDILIFKFTDFATPSRLCIWQTPGGITAKYARRESETITLHNEGDWKREFPIEDVQLVGVVVRVERDI